MTRSRKLPAYPAVNEILVTPESGTQFVGVASLAEVVESRIVAIVDSVSHYVRFCNGGELCYAFNRRGEVVGLSGRAMGFSVSPDAYTFQALITP